MTDDIGVTRSLRRANIHR